MSNKINDELYPLCKKISKKEILQQEFLMVRQAVPQKMPTLSQMLIIKCTPDWYRTEPPIDEMLQYLLCWQENEQYAKISDEKEYNMKTKTNKWEYNAKNDSRKMWKRIDYREKDAHIAKSRINPININEYLKNIFQAKNLIKNPTKENVQEDISHYNEYCHQLDRNFFL